MPAPIFLSAGVPILAQYREQRRRPFDEDYILRADPMRIRHAVMALIAVIAELKRELVFGGQPGITTSVEFAAESLGCKGTIHIFQSEQFRQAFPPVALKFTNFNAIPAGHDLDDSLLKMRRAMLAPERFRFSHAIFIGGMTGLYEEFDILRHAQSNALVFPVASTGGAAEALWNSGLGPASGSMRDALRDDLHYRRLFRVILS